MLDALIRATDRHIVTIVFFSLGLLNAPSWPYLAGFVAVGAMIDAAAPKLLASAAANKDGPDCNPALAYKAGWRWLYCLGVVFLVLDYGIVMVATTLSDSRPELFDAMGRQAFAIASPLSALLRSHYETLLGDGYIARANLVAVADAGAVHCLLCDPGNGVLHQQVPLRRWNDPAEEGGHRSSQSETVGRASSRGTFLHPSFLRALFRDIPSNRLFRREFQIKAHELESQRPQQVLLRLGIVSELPLPHASYHASTSAVHGVGAALAESDREAKREAVVTVAWLRICPTTGAGHY